MTEGTFSHVKAKNRINNVFALNHADRYAYANSVDPHQTPQNTATDLGMHCFPFNQQLVSHQQVVKLAYSQFWRRKVRHFGVRIFRVNTIVGFPLLQTVAFEIIFCFL